MPLLDLKTDLKSLKYGSDRPGGGNSGQPYIQNNINNPTNTVGNIDDGLIRGGLVGATRASATDTIRIGKFFTDLPKGPLFITKQVGLQLSNPRLETRKITNATSFVDTLFRGDLGSISNGLLQPTRIYNLGINTLAQVPVNTFGVHFNRHGITPVQDENTKYLAVAQANNQNTRFAGAGLPNSSSNRLVQKAIELLPQQNNNIVNNGSILGSLLRNIGSRIPIISTLFKPSQQMVDEYQAGPGSVYGIGKTFIRRYEYTVPKDLPKYVSNYPRQSRGNINYPGLLGVSNSYFVGSTLPLPPSRIPIATRIAGALSGILGSNLAQRILTTPLQSSAEANNIDFNNPNNLPSQVNQTAVRYVRNLPAGANGTSDSPTTRTYQELRRQIDSQQTSSIFAYNANKNTDLGGSYNGVINSYNNNPIVYNNGIDQPITVKGTWRTMNRETRIGSGRVDNINLTPIFESDSLPGNSVRIRGKKYNTRDLIKFRIGAINTSNPSLTNWMVFRAYLTGFQDSFNPEWSDIKYIGRGEKFKLYNGFDRSISFSFKVAALSAQEMEPMYQKLNYLASNTMPEYVDTVMRGPFMKFTVGDYINAQPGVITSLQYSVTDDTPWEISIDNPEGGSTMYDLPHIINVNLSFFPIGVKDGGLPEKKVSTPTILQSNLRVNGQVNPWLKERNRGGQVAGASLDAYRLDSPLGEIVPTERTRPESFINQTVTPRVPLRPVNLTRSV